MRRITSPRARLFCVCARNRSMRTIARRRVVELSWRLQESKKRFQWAIYNPPIKKYKVSNQKVQKRDVFFAPRFLYPFHTSKGDIFTPFDYLLYFLEGRRVDQIEHDDLIAACLHCGTAAAEGGNRIAQRLTLEGIV